MRLNIYFIFSFHKDGSIQQKDLPKKKAANSRCGTKLHYFNISYDKTTQILFTVTLTFVHSFGVHSRTSNMYIYVGLYVYINVYLNVYICVYSFAWRI